MVYVGVRGEPGCMIYIIGTSAVPVLNERDNVSLVPLHEGAERPVDVRLAPTGAERRPKCKRSR